MTTTTPDFHRTPLRMDRCPDLAPLRRALVDAGYAESALAQRLLQPKSSEPVDPAVMLRRTEAPGACNTLVRLFALARAVPAADAAAALGGGVAESLAAMGVLHADGGVVRSAVAIMPFEDILVVQDFYPGFAPGPPPPDHVIGVGHSSRVLADLTVRRGGEDVLDVGAGSGFQSTLAARHARRVVGTDINARALNFALFGARLNGVANAEFREGSLYAPAAEERFDLLVCNPPYVIAPQTVYQYCHGGLAGDGISEQVIRGAPARLRPGGFAVIIFNWHHARPDDWAERPTAWVRGNGCDTWFLRGDSCDPIAYAATWLQLERQQTPEQYATTLDAWVDYYARMGMGQMSSGILVLRRRAAGTPWLRAEDAPAGQIAGSCSAQVLRVFAAQDYLEGLAQPEDLLRGRFALTADHRLMHVMRAQGGRWRVEEALLEQARGMPYEGRIDRYIGDVLADCDGTRPLADLVGELAARLKVPVERLAPGCAAVMRKLLEAGFLEVRDAGA